jgi:hypothetical protein
MSRLKLTITIPEIVKEKKDNKWYTLSSIPKDSEFKPETMVREKEETLVLYSNTSESSTGERLKNSSIIINGVTHALTIKKLSFKKAVYHPCEITTVLSMSGYANRNDIVRKFRRKSDTLPITKISAIKDVNTLWDGSSSPDLSSDATAEDVSVIRNMVTKVKLDYLKDDKTASNIASEYYIQEITPRYINSGKEKEPTVEITLKIYSMDKRLTIDKYCRAYTGRKLFSQLINSSELDDIVKKSGVEVATVNVLDGADTSQEEASGTHEFTFLSYKKEADIVDSNTKKTTEVKPFYEFIQPYMVQYNESFYEFITRIANRCGEYIYFENGKLCMGLEPDKDGAAIMSIGNNYKSITYKDSCSGVELVQDFAADGKDNQEETKRSFDSCISFDDFHELVEKDAFTTLLEEIKRIWARHLFGLIGGILSTGDTVVSAIIGVVMKEAFDLLDVRSDANEYNETRNEAFINDAPADQIKEKKASLYSSYWGGDNKADTAMENLLHVFYRTVQGLEKYVTANTVEVDLGENFDGNYKLGKTIKFGDEIFVITEISGMDYMDDESISQYRMLLTPVITYSDSKLLKCPPQLETGAVVKSAPQVAYIADNLDPDHLGRVRVRFAWQKSTEDMSPLIQVSTPFATKNGGFYFRPQVNDKVLLNFRNGNIEHPYVSGSLHTKKNPVAAYDEEHTITSANGHCIKFTDPADPNEFIENLWGGWTLLEKAIPKLGDMVSFAKDISGGIELTDRFGLYSIEMSTTSREINISSPFGDVNINAFTGITISAPNGNVTIEGKNVDIVAYNNLSITSGQNVPDENPQMKLKEPGEEMDQKYKTNENTQGFYNSITTKKKSKASFVEGLGRTIGTKAVEGIMGKVIDLRLLRTILEAIIRPTTGNMCIKSWRFMQLEAGRGRAEIPSNAYTPSGLAYATSQDYTSLIEFNKCIKCLVYAVDDWVSKSYHQYNSLVHGRKSLMNFARQEYDFKVITPLMKKVDSMASSKKKQIASSDVQKILENELGKTKASTSKAKNFVTDFVSLANGYLACVSKYATETYSLKDSFMKYHLGKIAPMWLKTVLSKANISIDNLQTDNVSHTIVEIEDDEQAFCKVCKRMLIACYVEESVKDWEFPLFVDSLHIPTTKSKAEDDDNWIQFIDELHIREDDERLDTTWKEKAAILTGQVLDQAKKTLIDDVLCYDAVKSWKMWGPLKEGEILFSDKDNHTVSFDDGHLKHVKNNRDEMFLETAKDFMRKI